MLVVDAHLQRLSVIMSPSAPNFCAAAAERLAVGFDHNEAGAMLAQVVDEELDPQADDYVKATLARLRFDDALLAKLRVDMAHNLGETLSRATRPTLARL